MAKRASTAAIRKFLTELGLGSNNIEKITHRRDGSVTIYVTGLAEPVMMEAPEPAKPRARKPPATK